ncbi:response regulator transcription factor [Microbaculum marinum]|uniref:Response regulator transcription factor n=1 Tax=Microbaculum marinum TaxID=1764581 RepID=A0AAW9RJP9_9HYPH
MTTDPSRERDIVLVVDDSPDTLSLLTDALERSGATVLVAIDGQSTLSLVQRITPDIILLDAVMPEMDGFEVCRRLKTIASVSHVPVIFMTGLTETEHIVQGLEAGGVDYVTKPIVPDEILARIRVHLANARAAQAARTALDTAGRYLLAVSRAGDIRWSTPQAVRLLQSIDPEGGGHVLPEPVRTWLAANADAADGRQAPGLVAEDGTQLLLTFLGRTGDDEYLFRLTGDAGPDAAGLLRAHYGLTVREAEVLLWIGRGKSNRDIGEILGLSPRTVNKHLEQIYTKLGVENRASAAVLAIRVVDGL